MCEMKKDYSMRYFFANFFTFILIYFLCVWGLFCVMHTWLIRIVCLIILFFICGRIELKYLCYYVNYLVTISLPEDIRKEELQLLIASRNNDNALK